MSFKRKILRQNVCFQVILTGFKSTANLNACRRSVCVWEKSPCPLGAKTLSAGSWAAGLEDGQTHQVKRERGEGGWSSWQVQRKSEKWSWDTSLHTSPCSVEWREKLFNSIYQPRLICQKKNFAVHYFVPMVLLILDCEGPFSTKYCLVLEWQEWFGSGHYPSCTRALSAKRCTNKPV